MVWHSVLESVTEMKNTLSIDEEIVKKVRKIATDKNTTLTAMVRDYLTSIASSEAAARRADADKFLKTFKKVSREMGPEPGRERTCMTGLGAIMSEVGGYFRPGYGVDL